MTPGPADNAPIRPCQHITQAHIRFPGPADINDNPAPAITPNHPASPPGGRGMPTPPPHLAAATPVPGSPAAPDAGLRPVTGRHPRPPPRRPLEVCPCPHPATRPGSRSSWPRSAGTSCRCPRPANGRSATVAPAAPGTASPPTSPAPAPACPPAGWCHGVRAATTDPATITAWWRRQPRAVPGVAAGPSGLVLVDIDAHGGPPPPHLATGLLPGIDLATEPIPPGAWADPARFRDGRDTLALLARLRGGPRPWPAGPEHQPVTAATPSGGVHLWYQAPAPDLRQALSDPHGRYGLAWQIDLKAGWSYGIAPGATTTAGTYQIRGGDPARPGRMPSWLAREVIRVTRSGTAPTARRRPAPGTGARARPPTSPPSSARGAVQLAAMTDGRKRALSALAYHAGGLLAWSGLPEQEVIDRLINAGIASGLSLIGARRIVGRSLANGLAQPLTTRPLPAALARRHDQSPKAGAIPTPTTKQATRTALTSQGGTTHHDREREGQAHCRSA